MKQEKIQKIIAASGFCSRRKAEDLIINNKVYCNGKPVKIGDRALQEDIIYVENVKINKVLKKTYVAFNKPVGVVSTMKDEKQRPTVYDYVKKKFKERLYPIGRLDLNTQGLLLLTNDGEFARFVSHPSSEIKKTYKVFINKKIVASDVLRLESGVYINGFKTKRASVEVLKTTKDESIFLITIHEGKKRQIRNMVKKVFKCDVKKLIRIRIENLKLSNLPSGHMRKLTLKEISFFKRRMAEQKNKLSMKFKTN